MRKAVELLQVLKKKEIKIQKESKEDYHGNTLGNRGERKKNRRLAGGDDAGGKNRADAPARIVESGLFQGYPLHRDKLRGIM